MIKHIKKKALMVLLLLNLLVISEGTVYAEANEVSLELSVKQTIECKNGVMEQIKKTGTYELTSLTEDAPMPEGSEENVYLFSMDGADETVKIPLVYTHGGAYQYQLIQTTKDQGEYTYDRTSYKITVYIKNTENGGLTSEVIAEDGSGKKCGELKFQNLYQGKISDASKPTDSVKTGDQINLYIWGVTMLLMMIVFFFEKYTHTHKK